MNFKDKGEKRTNKGKRPREKRKTNEKQTKT